jgi:phosphonate transport system substrate-binding protein
MPKVIPLFAALLLTFASISFAETLKFAPLPMETPEIVACQWKPLLEYLQTALGIELEIDYSNSNEQVLDKFETGRLDLAYLGPLPYLRLKDRFPQARPLVIFHEADGQPTYTCALVVAAESDLQPEQLSGRKIALTQPLSTCGFFSISGLLQQVGIRLEATRYRYLGPHDAVALAVAGGEFDAGGLKAAIAHKYASLGLRIIAETAPLPGLALVANGARMSEERMEAIRRALPAADEATRKTWGDNIRHGLSAADDKDYAGARKLPYRAPIPDQGNF